MITGSEQNGYPSGEVVRPETYIKRQTTRHDSLPSFLGIETSELK
jgi:hypothetical protein